MATTPLTISGPVGGAACISHRVSGGKMVQSLTSTLRRKWIVEWDAETQAIDFAIDGESLKSTLLREAERRGLMQSNSSLSGFIGIPREVIPTYKQEFLKGVPSSKSKIFGALAPVLVCGGCGDPNCGGVWTRVVVSREEISWMGFGFWTMGQESFEPNYDREMRTFARCDYELLMRELIIDSP